MSPLVCPGCGRASARAARFCGACGAELAPERAAALRARELAAARRVTGSIAIVFLGTLAALLAVGELGVEVERQPLALSPLLCLVAVLAARVLGPGALRASVGRGVGPRWVALGLVAGVAAFALSSGFVHLVQRWVGVAEVEIELDPTLAVLGIVVLPALVEEWLCRGVLWLALRRGLATTWVVLTSAALFAFLHGLGGMGVLEYPHRFALGVIVGVLRARSGSLVPGVLAHATNNALALWSWSAGWG